MRRAGGLALPLVLALLVTARDAGACTCIQPGPACQAFWTTEAVFDGTVTSITPIEGTETIGGREYPRTEYLVRFHVRQAWKGVEPGSIDILTTESGGMCGYDFTIAGRYLVFAHRRGTDGRLGASICSLTRPFNGFDTDISPFLASLTGSAAAAARVFGSVTVGNGRFSHGKATPMELQVRLTGDGRMVTRTSTGGRYEFENLNPARYEIDITLPRGYSAHGFPRSVNIPDARACAKEDAWLSPDGRIVGRVAGPSGPAASVQVEIALADAQPNDHGERPTVRTTTDTDGTFEAKEIPPGRYLVGVNLQGTPTLSNRYARLLYPGAGQDGEVLTLGLGQSVDLGTLRIPAPLRVIKVTGTLHWRDGTPAADVRVFAQDLGEGSARFSGLTTLVDANGRFTIGLLEGRTYTLSAPLPGPRDRTQLDVAPFRVHDAMPPLTVTIPRDRPGPSHHREVRSNDDRW